jgi:transcriptional regulator with XRE-family HTH domain
MNAICEHLEKTGMTQTEFGKGIGVGQGTVYQWINGDRPVSIERALDIEERYGIDADRLNAQVSVLEQRLVARYQRRVGAAA